MTASADWPQHTWQPTDLIVGPSAWWATMVLDSEEKYLQAHPSLIMIGPDDDLDAPNLTRLASTLTWLRNGPTQDTRVATRWPVMLGLREPPFVRQLGDLVRKRIDALSLERVEVLTLWIDEIQDLKTGGLLQTLYEIREQGLARYIGLACQEARGAEWIAINTAVRVLVLPYHLFDQTARYRALAAACDHGMACLALGPHTEHLDSARFAVGQSRSALPVMDGPLPADLKPMDEREIERCWLDYQAEHEEPQPLPRSKPPAS